MRASFSKFLCAALGLYGALAASGAAAGPISASMTLTANAQVGALSVVDTDSDAWGTLLSPLSANVLASASPAAGGGSVDVFGAGNATFAANGLSGQVGFSEFGWNTSSTVNSSAALSAAGADFVFTFMADANGTFNISYDVDLISGNGFGLWGWSIRWDGPGGDMFLVANASDPTVAGSASRSIIAGQTYTLRLDNNANVSGPNGLSLDGLMEGLFSWSVRPAQTVPLPGSLALIVAGGLALLGARRRR